MQNIECMITLIESQFFSDKEGERAGLKDVEKGFPKELDNLKSFLREQCNF